MGKILIDLDHISIYSSNKPWAQPSGVGIAPCKPHRMDPAQEKVVVWPE